MQEFHAFASLQFYHDHIKYILMFSIFMLRGQITF